MNINARIENLEHRAARIPRPAKAVRPFDYEKYREQFQQLRQEPCGMERLQSQLANYLKSLGYRGDGVGIAKDLL